jgi:hypothetical protein
MILSMFIPVVCEVGVAHVFSFLFVLCFCFGCLLSVSWASVYFLCPGRLSTFCVLGVCLLSVSWASVYFLCPGRLSTFCVLGVCLLSVSWATVSGFAFLQRLFIMQTFILWYFCVVLLRVFMF